MARTEDLLAPRTSAWRADDRPLTEVVAAIDPDALTLVVPLPGAGVADDRAALTDWLAERLDPLGLDAAETVETHEPTRGVGDVCTVRMRPGTPPARRLLLVGVGKGTDRDLRLAGAAAGRAVRGRDEVVVAAADLSGPAVVALVEGATLGGWKVPKWTKDGVVAGADPAAQVTVVAATSDEVVRHAAVRARAQLVARCLALTPSNIKDPAWLAGQAVAAAERGGLEATVWDEKRLRAEGFGGLIAVGGGSASPPRLVRLEHRGEPGSPHVVLVGKGITFDTGGLQVKPADGMAAMKSDMSGAGIVLAVLAACREAGVRARVTGLLPMAENAVGGAAYRPGDVVTQYGGTTTEISNTDAEGRVVLADALAYARDRLAPDLLVDIATLTGAARVALARVMAPVYATDPALQDALVSAGETSGEVLWPMPLPADYRADIDSDVADVHHMSNAGGPGSIIAALFLREFVGECRWAHLDIAGTGRADADGGILTKGGTGFGTRLLLHWLEGL